MIYDLSSFSPAQLMRIYGRVFPDDSGYPYGWDWPTLRVVYPEKAAILKQIQAEIKKRRTPEESRMLAIAAQLARGSTI